MEELKFPQEPNQITFTPPLQLTRPITLLVGLQGHASVFLGSYLSSSISYKKVSDMKVKTQDSQFSLLSGQLFYATQQDQAFLYLKVGFNFPERLSSELASFLFSLNLEEIFIFDTLLSVQVYAETASIFTLKTATVSQSLDSWSKSLPPSVMKEGIVAALLIKGELSKKRVINISLRVKNRAMIEFQQLQVLTQAIVKLGGDNWALGNMKHVSLSNKVCRELIQEHNSRGSGIYS